MTDNFIRNKDELLFKFMAESSRLSNEAYNAREAKNLATPPDLHPEKQEFIQCVSDILNQLTLEKFKPLVDQIQKLKIDTLDKKQAVVDLVFEKAINEPNSSLLYAEFCQHLINKAKTTRTDLTSFRNALLDKLEQEFNQHVKINAKEEKLKPIREKYCKCEDLNEKLELKVLLNEEECKIRRRSIGTVRFIGETFLFTILTGKIINTCIENLLKDPNNEDMLECLCQLLITVGEKFEQTYNKSEYRNYSLKSVIQRMEVIANKKEDSKISPRIRFMLQDVIDLRKNNWRS